MATISEIVNGLNRISQVAGDIDVTLKQAGEDAETVLKGLNVVMSLDAASGGSKVVITHGDPSGTTGAPADDTTETGNTSPGLTANASATTGLGNTDPNAGPGIGSPLTA